jgi:hypothetical protein
VRARGATLAVAAVAAFCLPLLFAPPQEKYYRLIPGRGQIEVKVDTEGTITTVRHGLVLRARDYSGELVIDPAHLERSRVELRILVGHLIPVSPRMTLLEKAELVDWIRSTWGLDISRTWGAPDIAFTGSGLTTMTPMTGGLLSVEMPGRLRIRRRENPVKISALARFDPDGIMIWGRYPIRIREYDLIPYRDETGAYKMKETINISFRVFAAPAPEGAPPKASDQPPQPEPFPLAPRRPVR